MCMFFKEKHARLSHSPACLPAYLPVYLPACLSACLPACLPATLAFPPDVPQTQASSEKHELVLFK